MFPNVRSSVSTPNSLAKFTPVNHNKIKSVSCFSLIPLDFCLKLTNRVVQDGGIQHRLVKLPSKFPEFSRPSLVPTNKDVLKSNTVKQ